MANDKKNKPDEAKGGPDAPADALIDERLATLEERIFELPTRAELAAMVGAKAQQRLDRSDIPEVISVRTKTARRHRRSGHSFGREPKDIITSKLSDSELRDLLNDPLLQFSEAR